MAPMLLVSSLAQAVVGTLCVRLGVRVVLLASLASLLGCFAVLSVTVSLWQLYAAMMLLAIGNGIGFRFNGIFEEHINQQGPVW